MTATPVLDAGTARNEDDDLGDDSNYKMRIFMKYGRRNGVGEDN